MLDLVPFTRARWKMADTQGESQLICQALQRFLPEAIAAAVTATPVGRDQQLGRPREACRAHFGPPTLDTGAGELGGVVVDAHTDPTFVAGQVVDPIRNPLAHFRVGKV